VNLALTVDWQEYKNNKHQFKMKYPNNATPHEYYGGDMVAFSFISKGHWDFDKVIIDSQPLKSRMTIDGLLSQIIHNTLDIKLIRLIQIANCRIDALETTYNKQEENFKLIYISFLKDDTRYDISCHRRNKEHTSTFYNMVNSLKFV
jgi:hypothetical protein